MGEHKRPGTDIIDFTPDDTDTVLHIAADWNSISLVELIEKCKEKWPDVQLSELNLQAKHIHTECLGFDGYDHNDYTDYIVITRVVKTQESAA